MGSASRSSADAVEVQILEPGAGQPPAVASVESTAGSSTWRQPEEWGYSWAPASALDARVCPRFLYAGSARCATYRIASKTTTVRPPTTAELTPVRHPIQIYSGKEAIA